MTEGSPEIASSVNAAGLHDQGAVFPILFIHGSGRGVSAWANWRLAIHELAKNHRVIAPDMVGFGFTERPADVKYDVNASVAKAVGLPEGLGLPKTHIVGNSFGGAIALALAILHPERVGRLVLMGSVGAPLLISPAVEDISPNILSPQGLN